jgi:hypothetical protein
MSQVNSAETCARWKISRSTEYRMRKKGVNLQSLDEVADYALANKSIPAETLTAVANELAARLSKDGTNISIS